MLLNIEGFQCNTSLELNMGYYHIRPRKEASNLCTIILPWRKYKYKYLPMMVCNSLEIFQEKMNDMFCGMKFIRAYINDQLIITKGDCSNQLKKLEQVLTKFRANGLKCNIEK